MGAVWIGPGLIDRLRTFGLVIDEWPGAPLRSRSSGGYEQIRAIGIHHDAAPGGTPEANRVRYELETADIAPIGAFHVHRSGRITWGAGGATNTQGRGGPVTTSRGVIPADDGNLYFVSIEASNDGVREPWPEAQEEAYLSLVAALCLELGLSADDVFAHFEWSPGRKFDPAGGPPCRWNHHAGGLWDMPLFREHVGLRMLDLSTPEEEPMALDRDDRRWLRKMVREEIDARVPPAVWNAELGDGRGNKGRAGFLLGSCKHIVRRYLGPTLKGEFPAGKDTILRRTLRSVWRSRRPVIRRLDELAEDVEALTPPPPPDQPAPGDL